MATDAKKELRKQIKAKLKAMTEADVASQSQKAQELILSLPKYQSASRIGIYLSMPKNELRTSYLVEQALTANKKVFVPYISGAGRNSAIDMLRLHSLEDFHSLEPDSWGIPSLSEDGVDERENAAGGKGLRSSEIQDLEFESDDQPGRQAEESLDLIVMPGVAFDEGCNRLGHGRGYYDGFLTRFCADGSRKPWLVGLCLAEQLLPPGQEIPTTNSDWIVDAVVVGDGRFVSLDD